MGDKACRRHGAPSAGDRSRRTDVIRARQRVSYSGRQSSPSGATAGDRREDSPRTALTHVTGIPRNTKPSSHALSCRAAQAKDTASLLLLFSEHLHFAEYTSPKVPGILTTHKHYFKEVFPIVLLFLEMHLKKASLMHWNRTHIISA